MTAAIAALVFVAVVGLVIGLFWAGESRRRMGERLSDAKSAGTADVALLRPDGETGLARLASGRMLERLARRRGHAGRRETPADLLVVVAVFAVAGGLIGWMRLASLFWVVLCGAILGSLPIAYLAYRRSKRLGEFGHQFPDALDAMSRSIRAGNALGGSIQLVAEEMPDPVGQEFGRMFEEIRLGLDPGEALYRLESRVPTEDVRFFCTAVRIQRGAGGNLAEILDRLTEVIRERYKLLSHARVLSAQHRWTAIFVGLSPVAFALIFQVMHPGYFDSLLTSPLGPLLIGCGLVLEVVGFFTIWKIARIEV